MDGVHDMGGMDGFGKVDPEPNEPVFHQHWEGRVLAMSRAIRTLGAWNIDWDRYGIELLPPHVYLASSYYKRWVLRTVHLLRQRGLVETDEIAAGHALRPGKGLNRGAFTLADVERGRVGVVERVHGAHVFPDSVVAGKGEDPQWLFTVRFDAQELWGADADATVKISIEAFEPYLEHV